MAARAHTLAWRFDEKSEEERRPLCRTQQERIAKYRTLLLSSDSLWSFSRGASVIDACLAEQARDAAPARGGRDREVGKDRPHERAAAAASTVCGGGGPVGRLGARERGGGALAGDQAVTS